MGKKLAVAVIHGIGSQGDMDPEDSAIPTFSTRLHKRLRNRMGARKFDREIAWREIFWSDILVPRQMRYLEAIRPKVSYDLIREFILCSISDAAAYKKTSLSENDAYSLINARVERTIAELDQDTEDNAPLIVLAHSFGGHIISNYIWDLQQGYQERPTPFQRMETMGGFVTFGTNIPVFQFAFPPEDVRPISYPGTALANERRITPWWLNYYDRDDALAFPLREVGPRYEEMVDGGEIAETQIRLGGFFSGWNPLSHTRYWTDRSFYVPLAMFMKQFL